MASNATVSDSYDDECDVEGFTTSEDYYDGGCDTNHHRIVKYGAFKILTLKSKNNNCLVACFAYHTHDKRKHKTLVTLLNLKSGNKDNADILKLADYYNLCARIWRVTDHPTTPNHIIGKPDRPVIDILYESNHYYYIISGAVYESKTDGRLGGLKGKPLPGQSPGQYVNNQQFIDEYVLRDNEESNDFTPFVEEIATSLSSWYIDGGAGTGKTYLSNLIADRIGRDRIAMTATTGIAACHIRGVTIDRFMLMTRNKSMNLNTLLIDEVSMCDARKMDQIVTFCLDHKLRLILVGDIMQLPPVAELSSGWFFQSDNLRSMKLNRLILSKIRRTQNIEYAELCKRVRLGNQTEQDTTFLSSKHVRTSAVPTYSLSSSLFIASTNSKVDKCNNEAYASHKAANPNELEVVYEPAFDGFDSVARSTDVVRNRKIAKIKEKRTIRLCKGTRVIATKNNELGYANGMLGVVLEVNAEWVSVKFEPLNDPICVTYIKKTKNDRWSYKGLGSCASIELKYMPLRLGYAVTIHKSQGLTCTGQLLLDPQDIFCSGMFYTAITRVTNPDNLTIIASRECDNDWVTKSLSIKPSKYALRYLNGLNVPTMSELFIKRVECEEDAQYYNPCKKVKPLRCVNKKANTPFECYFFDFETGERSDGSTSPSSTSRIEPYLCTYAKTRAGHSPDGVLQPQNDDIFTVYKKGYYSSIPVRETVRSCETVQDPSKCAVEDIVAMTRRFEKELARRFEMAKVMGGDSGYGKKCSDIRKWANKNCPMFAAYNGSGFDCYFIAKTLLDGEYFDSNYTPILIMKGSQMVSFSIFDKVHYCTILRSHDLCQIIPMPLKDACKSFLPKDDDNEKIEFKSEILDISRNVFKDWKNWTIEDWKKPRTFEIEVDRDTGASLHETFQLTKQEHRASAIKKVTYIPADVIEYAIRDTDVLVNLYKAVNNDLIKKIVPSLTVFSFLTVGSFTWHLMLLRAKNMLKIKYKDRESLNLFSCNKVMDEFIRRGIYGGRACPRILFSKDRPFVYGDISGMYGSIQQNAELPCGIPSWVTNATQIENQINKVREFCKDKKLADITFTNLPTYWIAECEFQENPKSLEPVVPMKVTEAARSAYVAEHGGKSTIYTLEKRTSVITSLHAAMIIIKGGTIFACTKMLHMSDHSKFCQPWVKECLEGKSKYKGSALGSFYKILANSCYGQMLKQDHANDYKVVHRHDQVASFIEDYDWKWTVSGMGSYDIMYGALKTHNTNFQTTRPPYAGAFILAYASLMVQQILEVANPDEDPRLQPGPGDTDSLLLPLECIERLARPNKNGFTWFPVFGERVLPGQLTDELMDTLLTKTKFVKDEDCEKYKGKLIISDRWFSPCPKMLAVEMRDPINPNQKYYKFRSKGIAINSHTQNGGLMSAGTLFDYLPKYISKLEDPCGIEGGLKMALPSGLKRIAPSHIERDKQTNATRMFDIEVNNMERMILATAWKGRKHIGAGITVPYGYCPR